MSWIEDTGELYATQTESDLYVVLDHLETKDLAEERMGGWAERGGQALTEWFPELEVRGDG